MCHRFAVFLLLFLGASLLHGGELPDVRAMDILDNTRIIEARDLLSIHIIKASKEPEIITVGSDGEVKNRVLLKPMPATGLTCRTLAFNIGRQLERDYFGGRQIVLVKFASSIDVLDDRHIFVPGDTVSIRVLEDRRDVEQLQIPPNGMIQFRYVGAVKATGMTCRKLAVLIRQKLVAMPVHTLPFTYSVAPTVVVALDKLNYAPSPLANLKTTSKRSAEEQPLGASLLSCMEILDNCRSIEAGDELSLRILEDLRPAISLKVMASGEIEAPYVGKIKAAGQTSRQLSYQLKSKLQKRLFFRFPFFRKPTLRKATVIVCIDKLTHPLITTRCY